MTNRKAARRARRIRRTVLTVCLMALVAVISIGGTIAWLQSKSETIVNTFTTSNVSVTLTETKGADTTNGKSFSMVPGGTIEKDPKVTVSADSEDCYVFVKLDKSTNYGTYLNEYVLTDAWTAVTGVDGVYYTTAKADDEIQVLSDNQLTVKGTVTVADMTAAKTTAPSLTITAYAIQSANLGTTDMATIWGMIENK